MATKGVNVLVKIGTDVVGAQKGATLNRSSDTFEKTSKMSGGWKEFSASLKEWSIDADGLYTMPTTSGTPSFRALEDAWVNGDAVDVEFAMATEDGLASGDTVGYKGKALITDFPLEAPENDSLTFSVSFQGTGALTEITKA